MELYVVKSCFVFPIGTKIVVLLFVDQEHFCLSIYRTIPESWGFAFSSSLQMQVIFLFKKLTVYHYFVGWQHFSSLVYYVGLRVQSHSWISSRIITTAAQR